MSTIRPKLQSWLHVRVRVVDTNTDKTGVIQLDVLRTTKPIGLAVLDRLRRARVPLGPVALTTRRQTVEFVVPEGTAGSWPAPPETTCVRACATRWPLSGRGFPGGGRRWLVPPSSSAPSHTDADALCEAVAAALAHRGLAWLTETKAAA